MDKSLLFKIAVTTSSVAALNAVSVMDISSIVDPSDVCPSYLCDSMHSGGFINMDE